MKILTIIGVWLVVLIIDGIVLPALTGLPSGLGIMVLLSALAIMFGVHRWVIGLGIVLAGLTELILGTNFGVIIGAWLVMVWGWYFLNQFLNIKLISKNNFLVILLPLTLLGLIIFVLGEGAWWAISHLVYERGLALSTLLYIIRSPVILSVVAVELMVTLFVFGLVYSSHNSIYD